MARGAGRSRVGTVRRAARFFEAQPLGMNTFPPRSASSATSPRSVKWQRAPAASRDWPRQDRSEEHTSELQSLMRISYAIFCLKKKRNNQTLQLCQLTNYKNYNNHIYKH